MYSNVPSDVFAALTEAVAVALREMAGVEAAPREPSAISGADVTARLAVTTAAGAGHFVLELPEGTATALAGRVLALGEIEGEPDAAVVRDCAGEILNVLAGQAKTLLRGTPYHFTLSTPRVEAGAHDPSTGAFAIAFGSEVGPFVLQVLLPV